MSKEYRPIYIGPGYGYIPVRNIEQVQSITDCGMAYARIYFRNVDGKVIYTSSNIPFTEFIQNWNSALE